MPNSSPRPNRTTHLMRYSILLFLSWVLSSAGHTQEALGTPDRDDIEYPDDEPPSAGEIALGKMLFFDTRLSTNKKQSCATCHNPDLGFGDGLRKGIGTQGDDLGRNTPHIYNLAWNVVFFWDGRAASLEEQALGPIQSKAEMGMSLPKMLKRLSAVPYYRKQFKAVYGADKIISEDVGRAIAAFERNLISDNSPFDQYIAGDKSAMSPAAIRGLDLYQGKARCTLCHDGANFTDNSFHNIGTGDKDLGRSEIVGDTSLNGAFKTPGLRNVTLTAPYMHDGSIASLQEVIEFYDRGGKLAKNKDKLIKPLGLSPNEIMDLLAYLGALSDPIIVERPTLP
ncbi:MAG: cytochrome-c peroxidase [Alteromonadaceae bacterium]|nr:MAG: cytochrome-c peroxidase [Alteromonadaceae bacterium]